MTEGVYFRNLTGKEAKGLLELTESMGGDTPFEHSVACIGIPTCQIGLCNSQGVLKQTMEYFKENNVKQNYFPLFIFQGVEILVEYIKLVESDLRVKRKRLVLL